MSGIWFPAIFDDLFTAFLPLRKNGFRRILSVWMNNKEGVHVAGGYCNFDPGCSMRRGRHRLGAVAPENGAFRLFRRMRRLSPCRRLRAAPALRYRAGKVTNVHDQIRPDALPLCGKRGIMALFPQCGHLPAIPGYTGAVFGTSTGRPAGIQRTRLNRTAFSA